MGAATSGVWQPIDSAPKDGTCIDLWVERTKATLSGPKRTEYRVCDVRWVGREDGAQIGHWRRRRRDDRDNEEWLSVEYETENAVVRANYWTIVEPPPV